MSSGSGELSCNVLFEDKFSAARALQHMSQELPSPPPPEVGFMMDPGQSPNAEDNEGAVLPPDFGNMGWRFCQQPIRKVSLDPIAWQNARVCRACLVFVHSLYHSYSMSRQRTIATDVGEQQHVF